MTCLSDDGYTKGETLRATAVSRAALIKQAEALIIAVDDAYQVIKNYRKQRKIADRLTKLSEEDIDHAKNVYWGKELDFLNEFTHPDALEEVETVGRRFAGRLIAPIAAYFAKQEAALQCNANRFCTSQYKKQWQDIEIQRAFAISNARVLGRVMAFADYQARYGRNEKQRLQAIEIGRGLMGTAASLMSQASQGMANAGQVLSAQLNNAFNHLGRAVGYDVSSAEFYNNSANQAISSGGLEYGGSGTAPNPASGLNSLGAFGVSSSTSEFGSGTASTALINQGNGGLAPTWTGSTGLFYNRQAEKMNEADVGNRDLARMGSKTYQVKGGKGSVTIDMKDFKLDYVDDKSSGES